jgi:hypothetical protein
VSLTNISEREPLAYTVNDFRRMMGLGRATVYKLIAKGEIQTAVRRRASRLDEVSVVSLAPAAQPMGH